MERKQTRESGISTGEKNIWSIFKYPTRRTLSFILPVNKCCTFCPTPSETLWQLAGSTFCLTSCSESSKESAMQEIQIRSLGWEYLLEREMAAQLPMPGRPWTEGPMGSSSEGCKSWTQLSDQTTLTTLCTYDGCC